MAHNTGGDGGGAYDPRFHNGQFNGYYDPRYQQQPYPPPTQNFQIQVPMSGYPYSHLQQHQNQQPQAPQHHQQRPLSQQSTAHGSVYHANQQFYHQQPFPGSIQSPQFLPSPIQHHSPPPHQIQSPLVQHQSPPLQTSSLPPVHPPRYPPSPAAPSLMNGHTTMHQPRRPDSSYGNISSQPAASPVQVPAPAPTQAPAPVHTPSSGPVPVPVQAPVQIPPPPRVPTPMDLNYPELLLDLAEKYFSAAYGNGTKACPGQHQNHEAFCRLIATGLACLDVILGEFKSSIQPVVEASIRLRYATILYKETENYMDAEEMLSKGMSLCDRFRLTDLKYNMQHLLARATFLKNPKAAIRYLDGIIRDVEAVNDASWVYAMRFLRVALSLQMAQAQELLMAISQLKVLAAMANDRKDFAVAAIANSVEALIQIQRSATHDGLEQSQRALASARSAQLNPQAQNIPQLTVLCHFVDVLRSIYQTNPNEAGTKMVEMNTFLDQNREHAAWSIDGEFLVSLTGGNSQLARVSASKSGVVRLNSAGELSLTIQWLPKDEIYTLAYILSAMVVMSRNSQDGHQAETYLQQALKMLKVNEKGQNYDWRNRLQCQIQAQLVFALCCRSAWSTAMKDLDSLKTLVDELAQPRELFMHILVPFLEASILQGTGKTEEALRIYMQPPLSLESAESNTLPSIARDLSLLATLNALLIICLPDHPQHSQLDDLLARIEPLATEHPSKDVQAACHLVRAVSLNTGTDVPDAESTSMLKTKQYIQQALNAAKRTGNTQLNCITLNFMTWRYFRGVVGEQPVKSALSAQNLARKSHNSLWISVADGLLADTLDTQGRASEADMARRASLDVTAKLPTLVQRKVDHPGS